MDFGLNETQKLIQQTFRNFVNDKVKPVADEIDHAKEFPYQLFK